MRDPKRIDRILEKLRIIWTVKTDQRLGQLIRNLSWPHRDRLTTGVFAREDDEWESFLDTQIAELKNGVKCIDGVTRYLGRYQIVPKDMLIED